ncbi:hypothetical protein AHAS_Ahas01G0308200 [Arachis hypogaea]
MGAGLKKDLIMSRVGLGGSLNAFFFLFIGIFSQKFAIRYTVDSCMLHSNDELFPKR